MTFSARPLVTNERFFNLVSRMQIGDLCKIAWNDRSLDEFIGNWRGQ